MQKFEDGQLLYKKCLSTGKATEQMPGASKWKICIRSEEEKKKILDSCHSGIAGHFGRDKTLNKICSRFHWKNIVEDIWNFVKKCPQCQRMNANFVKSNAQLHPIPVQAKVWHQVSNTFYCSTSEFRSVS